MRSSFHLLVGSAAFYGAAKIYGQNLLLPAQAGRPPQFVAVVYAAYDLYTGSPAAALIIKTAFTRPMVPDIAPGSLVWNDIVLPELATLVAVVGQQARNPHSLRLGGVAARVAAMLQSQPLVLSGCGTLMVPASSLAVLRAALVPARAGFRSRLPDHAPLHPVPRGLTRLPRHVRCQSLFDVPSTTAQTRPGSLRAW